MLALTCASWACARHQRRPCRPKQPARLGGPGQGDGRLAGGQRTRRRRQQQLGPFGRPAVDLVQLADRRVGLLHGIPGQPRGRQRGAPVNAQIRVRGAETLIPLRRLIEAGQRLRQVAEPQGDQPPVHGGLRRLQFLAVRGEQVLGPPEVVDGASRLTGRQVADRPFLQRPGLPDLIAGRPQRRHRAVQILERLAVTPEDQQDGAAAEQHPAMQMPGGLPDRRVEGVAARHGPAGEDQRHPQRPEHVGFAIGRAAAAGQPPGNPQLTNGRIDVPVLPQHGADGLPRDRGVQRRGAAREHRPGTLQGLVGAGEREREQV